MRRSIHPGSSFTLMLVMAAILMVTANGWADPFEAVAPESWEWRNPNPPGLGMDRLAFFNGRFFSLGPPNINMVSRNGIDWRLSSLPQYARYSAMCKTGDKLVVLEHVNGLVYTSEDGGKTWKQTGTGPKVIYDMVYAKKLFVAVGCLERIYYSSDGLTWKYAEGLSQEQEFDLKSIAYGNNRFVAVGSDRSLGGGGMYTSSDGKKWKKSAKSYSFTGVFFDGKKFLASSSLTILESTDGIRWKEFAGPPGGLDSMVYRKGMYVGVNYFGIYTSPDARKWTKRLATTPLNGLGYGNGTYVAAGAAGKIYTSTDGLKWTPRQTGGGIGCVAVAHGDNGYVAISDGGLLVSPDAETWTTIDPSEIKPGYIVSPVSTGPLAYGKGKYVVGAFMWPEGQPAKLTNVYLVSENGIEWTVKQHPDKCIFYSIAFGNNLFVASGEVSSGAKYNAYFYTSRDGITWKRGIDTGFTTARLDFSNGTFLGPFASTLYLSKDGLKWTRRKLGSKLNFWGMAYDGNTYVAVNETNGAIYSSTDTVNWQQSYKPAACSYVDFPAIKWGGGLFLLSMGRYAEGEGAASNKIYVSSDGIAWKEITLYLDYWSQIYGAAYLEGKFTLVGSNGMVIQSGTLE